MFLSTGGSGIGQQDRTASTQQMWDNVNNSSNSNVYDPQVAMAKIREEADTTLKMMAFDAQAASARKTAYSRTRHASRSKLEKKRLATVSAEA